MVKSTLYTPEMVIKKAPMKLKGVKEMIPAKYSWPFASMIIGEQVMFQDADLRRKAQVYVHAFARTRGWKFTTITRDGALIVIRDINPR